MSHDHLTIATVAREDIRELLELRTQVLSTPGHRVWALSRDWSPRTRHWVARLNGTTAGCASVMVVRGHVLRGMAVHPDHQRSGIGKALLGHICHQVDGPLWCNARMAAVPFYESQGWVAQGRVFEMSDGGLGCRMVNPNQGR